MKKKLAIFSLLVTLIWGLGLEGDQSNVGGQVLPASDEVSTRQAAIKKSKTTIVNNDSSNSGDAFDDMSDKVADSKDFSDPEALRKYGVDRLMMMAFHNKSDIFLKALNEIDSPARINQISDKDGNGLLHWSVMGGCESCFLSLIAKGADVNHANARGETALVFAASSGEENMVKRLLQAGADPDVKFNNAGYTLLMDASFEGLSAVASDLLRAKANINARDREGQTALHYAAREGHRELIELLIKRGANSGIVDKNNMKPLDYALKYHDSTITEHFKL